jgi:hypothetical protein
VAARKKIRGCKVGGRGCGAFLTYLQRTLIPDTIQLRGARSGMVADLQALVKFLQGAKAVTITGRSHTKANWMHFVKNTLIPDLEESGSAYAEDFEEGLKHLNR